MEEEIIELLPCLDMLDLIIFLSSNKFENQWKSRRQIILVHKQIIYSFKNLIQGC